jgi:hypothetical protein
MNDEFITLYVLLCSTGLLLAAASIAILRFQTKTLESKEFWNSPTGSAIQVDDAHATRERNDYLEIRLAALQKLVDELSASSNPGRTSGSSHDLPFENAVRMAKQGATVEDLTRSCGLNVGEAQLIRRLHARRPDRSAAA